MGNYNLGQLQMDESLKNNDCPLCGKKMKSINTDGQLDAFEFMCDNCTTGKIVVLTGNLISSGKIEKLLGNPYLQSHLIKYINDQPGERVVIYNDNIND